MLERLMVAQAQECVFENTIAKGSTPGQQLGLFHWHKERKSEIERDREKWRRF
jgi:hypothetical protein